MTPVAPPKQLTFKGTPPKWRRRDALLASLVVSFAGQLPSADVAAFEEHALGTADIPALSLSGYGSVSGSHDSRGDLAPIRDISQRPDDGHLTGDTLLLDSRLAAQAAYRVDAQTGLVMQAVLRDQVDHSPAAAVELAYAEWWPHEAIKLRGGRIGYDAFLMSDHRNLGYANPTVRPPTEYYGWIPIFSLDGVDASHDIPDGDVMWKLKGQFGTSRLSFPMGDRHARLIFNDLWSLTVLRDNGVWRFKAGLSEFRIINEAAPLATLHDGMTQVAAATAIAAPAISTEATSLRRDLSLRNTSIRYTTLGANYDDGRWLAQLELGTSRSSRAIAPSNHMGYLLLGHRFGNLLPYALLSTSRPTKDRRHPVNDWSVIGQAATQAQAYGVVNSTRVEQRTLGLGTRWDFTHRTALKLQWDHVVIQPQGYGVWFRSLESNDRRRTVDLLTASVDFIF